MGFLMSGRNGAPYAYRVDLTTPIHGSEVIISSIAEVLTLQCSIFGTPAGGDGPDLRTDRVAHESNDHDPYAMKLCLRVNGTDAGCGNLRRPHSGGGESSTTVEVVGLPVTALAPGRNWIYLELRLQAAHDGVAAARPIALHVSVNRANANSLGTAPVVIPPPMVGALWPSVTLVLTLTMRDAARAMLLFATLAHQQRCRNTASTSEIRNESSHWTNDDAC